MVEIGFYLATESIARRAGVIGSRYRTQDGRYVLDDKDLSYIRLTPDEYLHGLEGIERVTKHDALSEIQMGDYQMGEHEQPMAEETPSPAVAEPENETEETPSESEEEPQPEAEEEAEAEQEQEVDGEEAATEETEETEENNELNNETEE